MVHAFVKVCAISQTETINSLYVPMNQSFSDALKIFTICCICCVQRPSRLIQKNAHVFFQTVLHYNHRNGLLL
jgi:hypothetical protein